MKHEQGDVVGAWAARGKGEKKKEEKLYLLYSYSMIHFVQQPQMNMFFPRLLSKELRS